MSHTTSTPRLRSALLRSRADMRLLLTLAVALGSSACNWKDFDEYTDTAPIRVYDAPNNYRQPGFGNVLTSFERGPLTKDRSIVVGSAGRNSPVVFERMWTGSGIGDEAIIRCKRKTDCKESEGLGSTLLHVPVWARGTQQEESGCILSPGYPKAYIFCDSNISANQSWSIDLGADFPADNSAAFFGGVGLPEGHSLGVALIASYQVSSRSMLSSGGRLFYQPDFQPPGLRSDDDEVPSLEVLPLLDPRTQDLFANDPEAGDLGYALASAPNGASSLLVAIAQPSRERVIVASYDDAQPGTPAEKLITRACVESPDPALVGFGKRIMLGDVNDDGLPELFVGIDPTSRDNDPSVQRVWMYRGANLPSPEQAIDDCPLWDAPVQVDCHDGVRGVECTNSAFGASLALGDVDGDGFHDLLVGAPSATVQGGKQAGAVWLIPGGPDDASTGGLDFDAMTNLYATKKGGARLGTAVTTLRTRDRHEPVAGAPGEDRVYTFMCSKLEDDVSPKSLCLPK